MTKTTKARESVSVEERTKLTGRIPTLMNRAAKLGPATKEVFQDSRERLKAFASELGATKSPNRKRFTEIEQAVLTEIEPELIDVELMDKEIPHNRQRRMVGTGGHGDMFDRMMDQRIADLRRRADAKALTEIVGPSRNDEGKVEVFVKGMVLRVKPETALAIKADEQSEKAWEALKLAMESQKVASETKIQALEHELSEWKIVASQPSSERIKEVLEEFEAITGHRPSLGRKESYDELKNLVQALSKSVSQGFEMLNRRTEKHDRQMEKIEQEWMAEAKRLAASKRERKR